MSDTKKCYAVLVGISDYAVNPLAGCVNDVLAIHELFQDLCDQPINRNRVEWCPFFYLAPNHADQVQLSEKGWVEVNTPAERTAIWQQGQVPYLIPTRNNLVNAFQDFADASAEREDICLFYYSGHGSFIPDYKVPVFQGFETYGRLQTIVCADDPRQDILDKELAYLIAKTLSDKQEDGERSGEQKGVHFVTLMDCCYSGTNTRSHSDFIRARMQPGSQSSFREEDIVGFTRSGNCFYQPFQEGQQRLQRDGLKYPSYFNLSASRGDEVSYEDGFEMTALVTGSDGNSQMVKRWVQYGIFTQSFIRVIRREGISQSYRQLMRLLEREVSRKTKKQTPLYQSSSPDEEHRYFLGNSLVQPQRTYRIFYQDQQWMLDAGHIQGIRPGPNEAHQPLLQIEEQPTRKVRVKKVGATSSILDQDAFGPEDFSAGQPKTYKASIIQMALESITLGFASSIATADQAHIRNTFERWNVKHARDQDAWRYVQLADAEEEYQFVIQQADTDDRSSFFLTRLDSSIPLFPATRGLIPFLENVNKVGKWEAVRHLSNPDPSTRLPREQFLIECKSRNPKIPQELDVDAFNVEWERSHPGEQYWRDPAAITLSYDENQQPWLGVLISYQGLMPPGKQYFIGALYLDAEFGITHQLVAENTRITDRQPFATLKFPYQNKWLNAIPLYFEDYFRDCGLMEKEDYLSIIIAEEPFDLEDYEQEGIEPGPLRKGPKLDSRGSMVDQKKWTVIQLPIRLVYAFAPQPLVASAKGYEASPSSGFTSQLFSCSHTAGLPVGLTLQPTNRASVRRRLTGLYPKEEQVMKQLPAGDLLKGMTTSAAVFTRRLAAAPDAYPSIIELISKSAPTLTEEHINAAQPLLIQPGDPLAEDEALLALDYEAHTGLSFPIGFSNEHGQLQIEQVPRTIPPQELTGGSGVGDTAQEKSIGQALRLYCHKVLYSRITGSATHNALRLVKGQGVGEEPLIYYGRKKDESVAEQIRAAIPADQPVLLLLHGLAGQTDEMSEFMLRHTDLHQPFGAVLAYDYENLHTPIEETAYELLHLLMDPDKCGLADRQITIVAQSTGGLVARWMIEQMEGHRYITQLIQVGTPNGGLAIAELKNKALGLMTMGLNGVAKFEPFLAFFSFLGKWVPLHLFRSLDQTNPEGTPLLKKLKAAAAPPDVPYYLIAGNTTGIEARFAETDPLYQKILKGLRDRWPYITADTLLGGLPNDLIVQRQSMLALPWPHQGVFEVEVDHLHYFAGEEEGVEKALRAILSA